LISTVQGFDIAYKSGRFVALLWKCQEAPAAPMFGVDFAGRAANIRLPSNQA
jgi:hypothetical protein